MDTTVATEDSSQFLQVLVRIYKYLRIVPRSVTEANYWFYNISNLAYTLILLLHASWLLAFYFIGQDFMKNVQLASISLYIIAIAVNRRGYHVAGMVIALSEVCLHQVVATASFGWATGFQNFIPLIALLPFLKFNENWVTKFLLGLGCMAAYLYIDFFTKDTAPLRPLSQQQTGLFNFSNTVLCFILVALWGIVLSISYQRSLNALIKKEQELFAVEKATEQAEILQKLELKEKDNEIYQLRNVELRYRNEEIMAQKEVIEDLVSEQEKTIEQRTRELADANTNLLHVNKKLVELIQYNSHNIREPLTRIMGAIIVSEYITQDEFMNDILPPMKNAVQDLDNSLKNVITRANEA